MADSDGNAGIEVVEQPDERSWDAWVRGRAQATFFHSSAWCRVLQQAYGYQPLYLAGAEDGAAKRLLPLMEVRSRLTGVRGVSLPFSDACEPMAPDARSLEALIAQAQRIGRSRGWKYFEIRGGTSRLSEAKPSSRYVAHTLDLAPGVPQLLAALRPSARTAIRKAEKSGVELRLGATMNCLEAFFRLHCLTRRKHGLPPQPLSFFRRLQEHVLARGAGFVVLAERAGRPLAATICVLGGGQGVYKYGASDPRHQHLRAANLTMWGSIQHCAELGCGTLFLGRTNPEQSGLIRFKESWGARPWGLDYARWDFRREAFVEADDGVAGLHNALFRILPVHVSRLIGSLFYRHMG